MLATTALVAAAAVAVAATAYAGICGVVAHRFTRALRKAPTLAAEFPELDAARVHFAARDQRARIDAWYLPAKPRAGAVVFVHGKDACRGDELKSPTFSLAQRLVAAGLSVLMIDLRGHGTSSAARLSYTSTSATTCSAQWTG